MVDPMQTVLLSPELTTLVTRLNKAAVMYSATGAKYSQMNKNWKTEQIDILGRAFDAAAQEYNEAQAALSAAVGEMTNVAR